MSEWKEYKLGDIAEKIGDGLHGTPIYSEDGEYYFINGNNLLNGKISIKKETKKVTKSEYEKHKKPLSRNTILLGINGTIGNLAFYNEEKCVLGKSACYINISSKIDKFFIYYKMLSKEFQSTLLEISTGTTIINVPLKGLRDIPILLPPLAEQKAIAGVLSALDDKIDMLHRQNKTLEAMAETLFRQWFVEEAEESWEEGKLGDIIDFNPLRSLSKGSIAPYLEMSNVSSSSFQPEGWYDREFSSGMKFRNGDTLLARITPCLENGKSCYVTFLESDQIGWGSTEFIVMRSKNEIHPLMTYALAINKDFRDYAEGCLEGSSGRQRVNLDHLKEYNILIPKSFSIFNENMESLEGKLHINFLQILSLEKLRETLLPKLMSGEVRVEV
ncbi:restriction endonuclease subunit S [Leptospira mtsangambouensis]|uniref:restriction endonuclease subunit S n=1 Tax=Leptospira mtsangambouensis TaxID=2484912 RepID=UPI001EEA275C|nr:restriction endonuclease subunit S [Leptospira mtsangambouensis]MCG6141664.1 restriction endonuclease subunit S [Leptospira mtsangambouensis]